MRLVIQPWPQVRATAAYTVTCITLQVMRTMEVCVQCHVEATSHNSWAAGSGTACGRPWQLGVLHVGAGVDARQTHTTQYSACRQRGMGARKRGSGGACIARTRTCAVYGYVRFQAD